MAHVDEPIYDVAHLSHIEYGIPIENGPGKHPIGQTFFVYVYDPGATGSSYAPRATRLSRRTGSRCAGPRQSALAARRGARRRSRASTRTGLSCWTSSLRCRRVDIRCLLKALHY